MVKIFSSNFVESEKNFSGLILFSVAKKNHCSKNKIAPSSAVKYR